MIVKRQYGSGNSLRLDEDQGIEIPERDEREGKYPMKFAFQHPATLVNNSPVSPGPGGMLALWKRGFIIPGLLLLPMLLGIFSAEGLSAEPPPNIVMIVGDDMGWTDYGFMGHKVVKTPHLDRLASEGVLFSNGYVPTSLCRASLATLLTGLYASQHKICCNDPPPGIDRAEMLPFLRDAPTIPRVLKDHGYLSLQTGKFWEGHFSNGGFTAGMTTKGRHGDDGLVIGRKTMQPIYDFVTSCQQTPFFVWYAPLLPHEPHDPPERIFARYRDAGHDLRQARYWAMCEWFDETCGELIDWLDQHGYRENTMIVYVVDNGWLQTNGPVRQGDQFLTIDLAPTILAACQARSPKPFPGIDLLPSVRENRAIDRHDVHGEIYFHDCVELGKPKLSVTHRWIRQDDWKLIVPTKPGMNPELYRVSNDPHEKQNLAESHPAEVKNLSLRLNERWNLEAESQRGNP